LERLKAEGLAVYDDVNGFVVEEGATSSEVMKLVETHLRRPYRLCQMNNTIFNPFNSIHNNSDLFVLPVHLCTRSGRRVSLAPGIEGVYPPGRYVKKMSKSKTKGSWTSNVIIFGELSV
jgi:hypothetical protein